LNPGPAAQRFQCRAVSPRLVREERLPAGLLGTRGNLIEDQPARLGDADAAPGEIVGGSLKRLELADQLVSEKP